MYQYSFEKLHVWKDAKELAKQVYVITGQFPSEEKFGLTSQLRRASISVSSNIAEGSSRQTSKEKAYFTSIAFSSAVEVLNQVILCLELDLIEKADYQTIRDQIEKITNKLNALRKSQQSE
jgi:four helix bundle protein